MRIELQHEGDFQRALAELHDRATAYEGPLIKEFRELAVLSAPIDIDEPLGDDEALFEGSAESRGAEYKERFIEALALLMEIAFPVNKATEHAVRRELSLALGENKKLAPLLMNVDGRSIPLKPHLVGKPTKREAALRDALLAFLPDGSEESM